MSPKPQRSHCPLSLSLDLVGDRWTLLLVRDLLSGAKTNKQLQDSDENIPSNILADRLKKMLEQELIIKTQYSERPPRYQYELSKKGQDLWPIIREFMKWGDKNLEGAELSQNLKKIVSKY